MAFRIFRKNCCGLDVHKTRIYACIGITAPNGRTEYKQARFSSFTKGLQELAEWLAIYDCTDVCMESSGKFWIPVFNILEKTSWVTLAHPKYTKPQKEIRQAVRMPSGFATCICVIWSSPALKEVISSKTKVILRLPDYLVSILPKSRHFDGLVFCALWGIVLE